MLNIIKRNGSKVPFNIDKIKKVILWACEGLNVNPLILESKVTSIFTEGISTRSIQDNLIQSAVTLTSLEEPQWKDVAGRLMMMNLWKETILSRGYGYPYSYQSFEDKIEDGIYSSELKKYSLEEIKEACSWIDPQLDLNYDYAGMSVIANPNVNKRYLIKDELLQETYVAQSLMLASVEEPSKRLEWAKEFYYWLSNKKISLATPLWINLRKPEGNLASCFTLEIEDDTDSIFRGIHKIAKISKSGGGVGTLLSKIRCEGSWIRKGSKLSGGVIPFAKIINDTAVAINQEGKRSGAVTLALDSWHLDVEEFLEIQAESGSDLRKKCFDIFPQIVCSDEFMRRAEEGETWTLVDPYEVKEKYKFDLTEVWGEEFEYIYHKLEAQLEGDGTNPDLNSKGLTLWKKVNARELYKKMMKREVETGLPYEAFKDTINKYNPNKHEGTIKLVNLCVAPETRILTDQGQIPIADLEGELVDVWNGEEWSEVLIKKTGTNQKLLKVKLSNGEEIECTYNHHFYIQNGYRETPIKIEAKDLKSGDKLIKYRLPIVSNSEDKEFPYAYTHGVFCGDGSLSNTGLPEVDLYGVKKDLVNFIDVRNKLKGLFTGGHKETNSIAIYDDVKQDRLVCKLPLDLPAKFTVPLNGYTIESRLCWLAGLLDTDGTIAKNGENYSLQLSSINKTFLLEIRLMLQTLGVDSKVTLMNNEGFRILPDGKGGEKEYYCKEIYRLLINSNGLYQLSSLGLKTNRLTWENVKPQREASQFVKVTAIEITNRVSDTYCFTEPKRHMGMFNGILTGQCTESFSVTKVDKFDHVCNLLSLNLANLTLDEIEQVAKASVRMLDNGIRITNPPTLDSAAHNDRYRTIGIGYMGLHDNLASNNLNYHTGKQHASKLAEHIAFYSFKASIELAQEKESFPAFEGSELSKGFILGKLFYGNKYILVDDLRKIYREDTLELASKYSDDKLKEIFEEAKTLDIKMYECNLNWNEIRKGAQKGIANSQLLAVAPNTTTSLIQGCTASVLPVFSRFFMEKTSKGTVVNCPPYLTEKFWFYTENKNIDQAVVIDVCTEIQKWIDTGLSMELVFDLNKEEVDAKYIFDRQIKAWKQEAKSIYYVRSIDKQKDPDKECTSCAG